MFYIGAARRFRNAPESTTNRRVKVLFLQALSEEFQLHVPVPEG